MGCGIHHTRDGSQGELHEAATVDVHPVGITGGSTNSILFLVRLGLVDLAAEQVIAPAHQPIQE